MTFAIHAILRRVLLRPTAVGLLVYQAFFLNVFLPGHTRGSITLEGSRSGGCDACCTAQHNDGRSKQSPAKAPSPQDRQNCAICHLAVRFVPAPVVYLKLPELGLLALLPAPPPPTAISLHRLTTFLGRAPPAFS